MKNRRIHAVLSTVVGCALMLSGAWGEPTGLKTGDRTPAFPVTAVNGQFAGKTVAYVSVLQGAPTLIVFVDEVDEKAVAVLAKAEELARRFAEAGLKAFGVSIAGQSAASKLKELAGKPNWALPLTVTRGGSDDPVCTQCKLSPAAKNTVLVSNKNQIVFAAQNLTPADFSQVSQATQPLVGKK